MADKAAHVLLADDNRSLCQVLQMDLEVEGYTVDVAHDGEEALAKARARRPDLILLDVRMPVLDGWATLAAVREDPELADVPVILFTMEAVGQESSEGRPQPNRFLHKPFGPITLLAAVRDMLAPPGPVE